MNKPKPSNVPIYAAIYPELASIAREHGYALAVHGSMQRDFDVVGIPWVENPSPPAEVVRAISNRWSSSSLPVGVPSPMWHGREAWTITLGMFGDCFIDLSFMPCSPQGIDEARRRALVCCFCGQQCRSLESLKNHSANCEKHPMYEAATAWRSVDECLEFEDVDGHGLDCDCDECAAERATSDCGRLPDDLGGGCQNAGSEYCDFECPFRDG